MEYSGIENQDLARCSRLLLKVFTRSPWNEPWDSVSAAERLANTFDTPGFVGVKSEDQGRIVAFLMGNTEPYHNRKDFYLKEMCVEPELQGHGMGTCLLEELAKILKQKQVATIYLLTRSDLPATRFYAKNGFHQSGRTVVMSRKMDDG